MSVAEAASGHGGACGVFECRDGRCPPRRGGERSVAAATSADESTNPAGPERSAVDGLCRRGRRPSASRRGFGHGGSCSGGHRLPGCACRRCSNPDSENSMARAACESGPLRGHGVTYTALDFSRLSSAKVENLRVSWSACPAVRGRSSYRRDGRAACFGSNDHRRACPDATDRVLQSAPADEAPLSVVDDPVLTWAPVRQRPSVACAC